MRWTAYAVTLSVAASVMIGGSTAPAQERTRSASAVVAAVRVDMQGSVRDAREFLLQVHRKHTPAELDAVAEALVHVATTSTDTAARQTAVEILAEVATDTMHAAYAGTADALLRIARDGNARAAISLSRLPDRQRAMDYLRRIAIGAPTSPARSAMRILMRDMGSEGVELAHELYRKKLIMDPYLHCWLQPKAEDRGWKDPGVLTIKRNGAVHVLGRFFFGCEY